MLTTAYQRYLLDCLQALRCLRTDQLEWLMGLKFGSTPKQVEDDLRRLQYMGLLCRRERIVHLPGGERDGQMLACTDVMRLLCRDSLPEFTSGCPPCKLAFYLEDQRGYLDFKVVPVVPGEERRILLLLEPQLARFVCTCIFLLQSESQIPKLAGIPRSFFALPDGKGGYQFIKADAAKGGITM